MSHFISTFSRRLKTYFPPVRPASPRLRLRLQLGRQDQELLRLDRPLLLQRQRRQLPPAVRQQVRPAGSRLCKEQTQHFRRWWRRWLADDPVYPATYRRQWRRQHRERKFRSLSAPDDGYENSYYMLTELPVCCQVGTVWWFRVARRYLLPERLDLPGFQPVVLPVLVKQGPVESSTGCPGNGLN